MRICKDMEEIGEKSAGTEDFQLKFASSSAGQEYYGLFSQLQVKMATPGDALREHAKQTIAKEGSRDQLVDEVSSAAKRELEMAAKREIYAAERTVISSIPGGREAVQGKQLYDLGKSLTGLFGRKKK